MTDRLGLWEILPYRLAIGLAYAWQIHSRHRNYILFFPGIINTLIITYLFKSWWQDRIQQNPDNSKLGISNSLVTHIFSNPPEVSITVASITLHPLLTVTKQHLLHFKAFVVKSWPPLSKHIQVNTPTSSSLAEQEWNESVCHCQYCTVLCSCMWLVSVIITQSFLCLSNNIGLYVCFIIFRYLVINT